MANPEIVIRDAYLADRDSTQDIAIRGDRIRTIADTIGDEGVTEIEADGNVVAPGFVDSHIHMDQAFSAEGERYPKFNDQGGDRDEITTRALKYYDNTTWDVVEDRAVRLGKLAASKGSLYMRTHVNVMEEIGLESLEAMLSARERLEDIIDVQIILLTTNGILNDSEAEDLVNEGLRLGGDVVGGTDPASMNNDVERTIDTWLDVAAKHDAEVDAHIHDPSTLGMYVMNRLAEKTIEHGYEGNVTASHAYGLAGVSGKTKGDLSEPGFRDGDLKVFKGGDLEEVIPTFKESGLKFVSCHPGSRPGMPIPQFQNEGIPMAWGSDNIQDFVNRHTKPSALQGSLVNAFKLDYNLYSFATNQGLEYLWNMVTEDGAKVYDVEDEYGIEEGNPANLVVLDALSPQWAIINQADREYVIKDGDVIVEDNAIVPEKDPLTA